MKTCRTFHRRQGMAPLELVFSLPIILAIGGIIFTLGLAGVNNLSAVSGVRHEVWKMRPNAPEEFTSRPLAIASDADAGAIEGDKELSFGVYSWLGGSHTTQSRAAVLGGTWDHREIQEFQNAPGTPHIATILRAVGADQQFVDAANLIIGLLSFSPLNQGELDDAQEGANEAQQELDAHRQAIQDKINELEEEKAALESQRDALVQQRSAKQAQADQLSQQIQNLIDNDAPQSQIDGLQDDLDQLEDEIDQLDDQIDDKNDQIDAKQDEIDQWQDEWNDAEQEGASIG